VRRLRPAPRPPNAARTTWPNAAMPCALNTRKQRQPTSWSSRRIAPSLRNAETTSTRNSLLCAEHGEAVRAATTGTAALHNDLRSADATRAAAEQAATATNAHFERIRAAAAKLTSDEIRELSISGQTLLAVLG
jgi:hypothetical protein